MESFLSFFVYNPSPVHNQVSKKKSKDKVKIIKEEIKESIPEEVKEEVKEEVTHEVKEEVTHEIKEEVKEEIKEEVTHEVKEEEIKDEEIKEEEIKEEEIKEEVKEEVQEEEIEDNKYEVSENVSTELSKDFSKDLLLSSIEESDSKICYLYGRSIFDKLLDELYLYEYIPKCYITSSNQTLKAKFKSLKLNLIDICQDFVFETILQEPEDKSMYIIYIDNDNELVALKKYLKKINPTVYYIIMATNRDYTDIIRKALN
jgi:hypothetical protein